MLNQKIQLPPLKIDAIHQQNWPLGLCVTSRCLRRLGVIQKTEYRANTPKTSKSNTHLTNVEKFSIDLFTLVWKTSWKRHFVLYWFTWNGKFCHVLSVLQLQGSLQNGSTPERFFRWNTSWAAEWGSGLCFGRWDHKGQINIYNILQLRLNMLIFVFFPV